MVILICCITELLFTLFEPLIGSNSIQYANGQDWEDRRKWLYESLKGPYLESYVPHFVKVCVCVCVCVYVCVCVCE